MTCARTSAFPRFAALLVAMLAFHAGPALAQGPADAGTHAAPSFPEAGTRAWQTGLLRPDRLQHASLALTIGLGIGVATREPAAAFAAPAALGLGKEIADRHGSGFDPIDLVADLLGAGAAAWVASRLEP